MPSPIETPPAAIQALERSGRWQATSSGSLVASWCGASIRFLYYGQALSIRTGALTERKDRYNGGTPMLACTISGEFGGEDTVMTYDLDASQTVLLYTGDTGSNFPDNVRTRQRPRTIELMLIDWASVFELQAIIAARVEDICSISADPVPRILFIGDSVSCGFSDGSRRLPRGCLDAFPFLARDILREKMSMDIAVDLIAFPGIRLVDPTEEEAEEGTAKGMMSRFFHVSPWSDDRYEGEEIQPTFLVFALGTNDDAEDVELSRFFGVLESFITRLSMLYSASLQHIILIQPFPDFTSDESVCDPNTSLAPHFPSFANVLSEQPQYQHINIVTCDIADLQQEQTMDGLHPTADGQVVLGKAWAGALSGIVENLCGNVRTIHHPWL